MRIAYAIRSPGALSAGFPGMKNSEQFCSSDALGYSIGLRVPEQKGKIDPEYRLETLCTSMGLPLP